METLISGKSKLVAWFVAHCSTPIRREEYVRQEMLPSSNNSASHLIDDRVHHQHQQHFEMTIATEVAESDKHVNNDVIHANLKNSLIETTIIKDFVVNFRQDRSYIVLCLSEIYY